MRKLFGLVAVAAIAFAGQAHATVVNFTGDLSVQIATLPPIASAGSGTATLNGSSGLGALTSVALAGGEFGPVTLTVPVTDPAVFPIAGVKAIGIKNGAANFALGGPMAVKGLSNVCLFGACSTSPSANVQVPFTLGGTRGIGLGGGPIKVKGAVNVTVQGSPWAITAAIGTVTRMGFVHGPASGGASSAAGNSGVLSLVTPVFISTNIGASAVIPAFASLNLHFDVVPEPGTLLLLGAGVAGLAAIGRKKMGK